MFGFAFHQDKNTLKELVEILDTHGHKSNKPEVKKYRLFCNRPLTPQEINVCRNLIFKYSDYSNFILNINISA